MVAPGAPGRNKNIQQAIDTCRAWAAEKDVNPWPYLYRLIFAILTETGGRVYANDGGAFFPDGAARRPGWDKDDNGNPLPDSIVSACYAAVRKSFDLPHDAVGNNGGSTGILQQLSQDYLGARFPGKTWGWGSLEDTMNIDRACRMFLDRVRVTSGTTYLGVTRDPIAVDVLNVQQPLASEAKSDNYSDAAVKRARDVVDNWNPNYFQD